MKVEFDKSFLKSLQKIKDSDTLQKIELVLIALEKASSLKEMPRFKKLTGHKNYYRIRIGDYRMGFEKIGEKTLLIIIIAHRKDIYKKFP